jgi:hypothetical protein
LGHTAATTPFESCLSIVQHPWFLDAKASRDSKYRNFFYWRNGRNGDGIEPPNNWRSVFGGSAWTYVDETEQWYLHQYHTSQPDLNWENPELRDGVWLRVATVMRLWKLKAMALRRQRCTTSLSFGSSVDVQASG